MPHRGLGWRNLAPVIQPRQRRRRRRNCNKNGYGNEPLKRPACALGDKFLTLPDGEISMSQESLNQESLDRSLESRKPQDFVQRFFGGPPLAVLGRLVLLSILVGVILA